MERQAAVGSAGCGVEPLTLKEALTGTILIAQVARLTTLGPQQDGARSRARVRAGRPDPSD